MRRMIVLIYCLFAAANYLYAQEEMFVKAIADFLSCDIEEVMEEDYERLSEYIRRPLKVNVASMSELLRSGLFTRFQAASIIDYRSRSAQILSLMELSSLDGFGEDSAEKIRPFISLEYISDFSGRNENEITARISSRTTEAIERLGYASRYKMNWGDALNMSIAMSRSLTSSTLIPDAVCGSVEGRFRRIPLRVVAGDYNARFGQGLALWSGVSFNSLNSPSSFMKRASGITASTSFTGSSTLRGLAAEYLKKNLSITAGVTSSFTPLLNMTWLMSQGQVGITYGNNISTDASLCLGGVDLFAEFAYDKLAAIHSFLAGTIFPAGDLWNFAAMIKACTDGYSFTASGSRQRAQLANGTFAADFILYPTSKTDTQEKSIQIKFHSQWHFTLSETLSLTIRGTERLRNWGLRSRTDLRTDLLWNYGRLNLSFRMNALKCRNASFLSYIEEGITTNTFSLYFKQGVFVVDHWDDRIYAYERDAPGCYNSPAFYGRGVWTSLMASIKSGKLIKLYFRAGYTTYPFMKENKPGKAELRFQSVFDF